ncbi:MAG TPA: CopG family transcriptional regulator [Candidatus Thermoplasmatota archaeon]|nr:CopG family transcriptional regulator [Candidatus Thermoplasmatota archaeon]
MVASGQSLERKYTTISIPTQLYKNVEQRIENTGFRSVTEFIVFVTRETLAGDEGTVVERLRALGYIE